MPAKRDFRAKATAGPHRVSLPAEGRPLADVYEWAVRVCSSRQAATSSAVAAAHSVGDEDDHGAHHDHHGAPAAKRRRSRTPGEAHANGSAPEDSSPPAAPLGGYGALEVEAGGSGLGAAEEADGAAERKRLRGELRAAVKAAAIATRRAAKGRGGAAPAVALPIAALLGLAAAVPLARRLMAVAAPQRADAARDAAAVLLAAGKALRLGAVAEAEADPVHDNDARRASVASVVGSQRQSVDGGVEGTGPGPALASAFIAALWAFVLARPLAARAVGLADVILAASGLSDSLATDVWAEGAGRPQAVELSAREAAWMLPSAEAFCSAVGGAAPLTTGGGAPQAWEAQLPLVLRCQAVWALAGPLRRGASAGQAQRSAGSGAPGGERGAAAVAGLAASGLAAAFWLPLLPCDDAVAAASASAAQLLRAVVGSRGGGRAQSECTSSVADRPVCGYGAAPTDDGRATLAAQSFVLLLRCRDLLRLPPAQQHAEQHSLVRERGARSAAAQRRAAASLLADAWRQLGRSGEGGQTLTGALAGAVATVCREHATAAADWLATAAAAGLGMPQQQAFASQLTVQLLPLLLRLPPRELLPLARAQMAFVALPAVPSKARKSKARASAAAVTDDPSTLAAGGSRAEQATEAGVARSALSLAAALLTAPSGAWGERPGAGGEAQRSDDPPAQRFESLIALWCAVQVMLGSAAPAHGNGGAPAAGAAASGQDTTAVAAASTAAAALRGPWGASLAQQLSCEALQALTRLAAEGSADAAAAVAAALHLRPSRELLVGFASALAPSVSAAEARLPGSGRRHALASLLPAADAALDACEAAAGPSDANTDVWSAVSGAFREPLVAYALRKRRKEQGAGAESSAAAAAGRGLPACAVAQLRRRAVLLLARLLSQELRAGGEAAREATLRLLRQVLPRDGACDSISVDSPPASRLRAVLAHHGFARRP
jgi:hypothetical protein